MRDFCRIEVEALNGLDTAIARFSRNGVLTYLNPAGERLLGATACEHVELRMLFPDDDEFARVIKQLGTRLKGRSSAYETSFRPVNAQAGEALIPVNVYAFPDTDDHGEVIGSVALLRDLREERARAAIHAAIESSTRNVELFAEVARQLQPLFAFDEFRVSIVSKGRMHIRQLYSSDDDTKGKYPHRWWPMPPFLQRTVFDLVPGVIEVDDMRNDPEHIELAKTDEAMRYYLSTPVRQVLSIPIRHGNRIVAFFSLDSNKAHTYTQESVALLMRLPVAQSVMSAIDRAVQNRQNVILDLVRRLGANAVDVRRVAGEMVDCLGETFGWSHVSIFQRDANPARARLVCQANYEHPALPDDFSISCTPADPGPLAQALLLQKCVNQPGSREGSPFLTLAHFSKAGSTLAIPVTGRKTQWVLYVESTRLNAFATEEEEMLTLLAREAAAVLHRSELFELQVAVLGAINDSVIETNNDGCVRWTNEAAKKMLDLDPEKTGRILMDELLRDDPRRVSLQEPRNVYHEEAVLRTPNGRAVPVVLSASTLPQHLGGRVYVASDISFQKELHKLDMLKEVFRHAALEGRIPLALAATWLQQCNGKRLDEETVAKVVRQLGRADLPLERLLRLVTPEVSHAPLNGADLGAALRSAFNELPDGLREHIDCAEDDAPLPVDVEFNDLQFCVESLISFGLRTRPQWKKLRVRTVRGDKAAMILISGDWSPDAGSTACADEAERWRRKTLFDLTLGESVIARVIERAGGSFVRELDGPLALEIRLPYHGQRSAS